MRTYTQDKLIVLVNITCLKSTNIPAELQRHRRGVGGVKMMERVRVRTRF